MLLIGGNGKDKIDLSQIDGVTEIYLTNISRIAIHLGCKLGDEKKIIDSLPEWIHNTFNIHQSYLHIYLTRK